MNRGDKIYAFLMTTLTTIFTIEILYPFFDNAFREGTTLVQSYAWGLTEGVFYSFLLLLLYYAWKEDD